MKRSPILRKRHGSTVILIVLATLAFSLAAPAACESLLVAGAGYAPANGTYLLAGEAYGKPTYELGADYRITWMGKWYLSDFVGGTYYENDSSADEPPSAGWISYSGYAPAPTVSCADALPAEDLAAPRFVGLSYRLEDGALTLVYENVGDASGIVSRLCAGPALIARSAEGVATFWIPDSDLWQILPLDRTYHVEPGETLSLVLPTIELPEGWLEEAAARSAVFTGFTFGAPHIAVGVSTSPASWIHLVPEWLEQQAGG